MLPSSVLDGHGWLQHSNKMAGSVLVCATVYKQSHAGFSMRVALMLLCSDDQAAWHTQQRPAAYRAHWPYRRYYAQIALRGRCLGPVAGRQVTLEGHNKRLCVFGRGPPLPSRNASNKMLHVLRHPQHPATLQATPWPRHAYTRHLCHVPRWCSLACNTRA